MRMAAKTCSSGKPNKTKVPISPASVSYTHLDVYKRQEIMRFLNRASDLCFAMARDADVDDPSLFEGRRKSS